MTRTLLIALIFCLFLLLASMLGSINGLRIFADNHIMYPTRIVLGRVLMGNISPQRTEALLKNNYEETITRLQKENKILRSQLGAMPEEGKLYPGRVIWTTTSELIVNFPYQQAKVPVGTPVVLGNLFIGTVAREEGETLVVYKATHSLFSIEAKSEVGAQGKVVGSFNEEAQFETTVDAPLSKKDKIYAIDKISGGLYLVGTVKRILLNERLPIKRATVDYLADAASLETVFILLK